MTIPTIRDRIRLRIEAGLDPLAPRDLSYTDVLGGPLTQFTVTKCPECFALLLKVDQVRHTEWHQSLDGELGSVLVPTLDFEPEYSVPVVEPVESPNRPVETVDDSLPFSRFRRLTHPPQEG